VYSVKRQTTSMVVTRLTTSPSSFNGKSTMSVRLALRRRSTTYHGDSPTALIDEWTPVTAEEVDKLISAAPNKTCQLDPPPTWLVKEMRGLLVPFVALLLNKSLTTGCFPTDFKHAVVRPLLKKSGLDVGDTKNYRPV